VIVLAFIGVRWGSNAAPREFAPDAMTLSRGEGRRIGGRWMVAPPASGATSLVALTMPAVPAGDYPSLRWEIAGADAAPLGLLWRSDREPGRIFSRSLDCDEGICRASLANEPAWRGSISGVALAVQGYAGSPLQVGALTLEPMSLRYSISRIGADWGSLERWSQHSINYLEGGSGLPLVRLAAFAALVLGAALAGYAWTTRRRHSASRATILWLMLAGVWMLVDARWLADSAARAAQTLESFAGKSESDRLRSAEDGGLYAFIAGIRPQLEKEKGRLFVFSDDPYLRGRTAWHLLPLNAWHDLRAQRPLPSTAFRGGDVLILVQQRGIGFSREEQKVRWVDGQTFAVDPLALAAGSAVFRVR
jgi:hypothetical protein